MAAGEALDELVERLPKYGLLLAKIKQTYKSFLKEGDSNVATNRKIQLVSELHQASASNYSAFKKELLQRLSVLGAENAKLKKALSNVKHQISVDRKKRVENLKESAKKEKEEKSLLHKQLNLLPEEAADSSVLEKELLRVKERHKRLKLYIDARYVQMDRKVRLQRDIDKNEEDQVRYQSRCWDLAVQCLRLKNSLKVAKYYRMVGTSKVDLSDLVSKAMNSQVNEADVLALLDDEASDPSQQEEQEYEIILDCIQKFNGLFDDKKFKEAAMVAANATKGVLRTLDVFGMFHAASKDYDTSQEVSQKVTSPIMYFIKYLILTTDAFGQLPADLSISCIHYLLQIGRIQELSTWIYQGKFVVVNELVPEVLGACYCLKKSAISCGCLCPSVGFKIAEICSDFQQAALCLCKEGKITSAVSYGMQHGFTKQAFASLLLNHPEYSLGKALMSAQYISDSCRLTLFQVLNLLLMKERDTEAKSVVETFIGGSSRPTEDRHHVLEELIQSDNQKTSKAVWESLVTKLKSCEDKTLTKLGESILQTTKELNILKRI